MKNYRLSRLWPILALASSCRARNELQLCINSLKVGKTIRSNIRWSCRRLSRSAKSRGWRAKTNRQGDCYWRSTWRRSGWSECVDLRRILRKHMAAQGGCVVECHVLCSAIVIIWPPVTFWSLAAVLGVIADMAGLRLKAECRLWLCVFVWFDVDRIT